VKIPVKIRPSVPPKLLLQLQLEMEARVGIGQESPIHC
jgi:hypothetical protein